MTPPFLYPRVAQYSHVLVESFLRITGRPMLESSDIPHTLYNAPFALVSHGTEPDPVFCYANLTAQNLWAIPWDEFTAMPSRLSAEPIAQQERQRLLDEASAKGYVDNYSGVRITKNGKRFMITNTLLWNVTSNSGVMLGQAALIRDWKWCP